MARRLRFNIRSIAKDLDRRAEKTLKAIGKASTAALEAASEQIVTRGRANIANAGFTSNRWRKGFKYAIDDRGTPKASSFIWHSVPYAHVFEQGSTIRGKPLLWLPLSTTPKLTLGKRLTPERFVQTVGPLVSISNARKPLLGAPMAVNRGEASRPRLTPTVGDLRRGAALKKQGRQPRGAPVVVRTVPLFVGVPTVTLRKRFALKPIIYDEAARLADYYYDNLKVD